MFVELLQLAEFGPQHDWDLADRNSVLVELFQHLLDFLFSFLGVRVLHVDVLHFLFGKGHICKNLCCVRQISDPGLVREQRSEGVIMLEVPRMLADGDLAKLDFPNEVLVRVLPLLARNILRYDIDLHFAYLVHDFLHVELDEAVERGDLLRHKAVLGEVAPDDSPSILLVNVVSWQGSGLVLLLICRLIDRCALANLHIAAVELVSALDSCVLLLRSMLVFGALQLRIYLDSWIAFDHAPSV